MSEITRREFMKASAATSVFLLAGPRFARAADVDAMATFGTARSSRLFPDAGFVVHTDLHNHTLYSDGAGSAADAFTKMRAAGLDAAATTDHAIMGKDIGEVCKSPSPCTTPIGINETSWGNSTVVADAANAEPTFVAMRGFEWSTGTIGHINVWFTKDWTDANRTRSLITPRGIAEIGRVIPGLGQPISDLLSPPLALTPELATMDGFYEWLASDPSTAGLGGGADGIAGFNHPNLYGNFEAFKFAGSVRDRMVSCEALNGYDDYLFFDNDKGKPEPLNACLNAGWRTGFLGTTDEHSANFAGFERKGRGGLWVTELSRQGIKEALSSRRFFATRERGLRVDASLNGVRMGRTVGLVEGRGTVRVALDIDKGTDWYGKVVNIQTVRPGAQAPVLLDARSVALPSDTDPVITFDLAVDIADGEWIFVRITDPERPVDQWIPEPWKSFGGAVAYTSPWWLNAV